MKTTMETEHLTTTGEWSERETWLDHRGHKILKHSYVGLSGDPGLQAVHWLKNCIVNRKQYNLLFLIDITDAYANKEILAAFKNAALEVKPFIEKTAVVGATGVLAFFLHLINKFSKLDARPFDTVEEALDWLIS